MLIVVLGSLILRCLLGQTSTFQRSISTSLARSGDTVSRNLSPMWSSPILAMAVDASSELSLPEP